MKENPRLNLPRNRRIIFTDDAVSSLVLWKYPITPEDYLGKVDYLSGTQVGIYQWCLGSVVAFFDSKVIESWGSRQADYDNPAFGFSQWLVSANFQHLIRTGNDPLRLVVERGHQRGLQVWGSRRMNDGHHTYAGLETIRSKFYIEHPELRLPSFRPEGQVSAIYDWCKPAVLEQDLEFLTDADERYDLDGIDLDFSRGGLDFSSGDTKYKQEVGGGHVRKIRKMLDRVGKRKGKYLGLSAQFYCYDPLNPATQDRTAWKGNIQSYHDSGADIRSWAREGLIDILVGQCRSASLHELEIGDWAKAVEGTDCLLMIGPGKPSRRKFSGPGQNWTTVEEHRAIAHRLYEQGADGIAFYDYVHHGPFDLTPFRELGDPGAIRFKTKSHYHQLDLPRDIGNMSTGGSAQLDFDVPDDIPRAQTEGHRVSARLRLNVTNINVPEDVRCFLNGTEVALNGEADLHLPFMGQETHPKDTARSHLEAFPDVGLIRKGKNQIRVETLARYPNLKVPCELYKLELRIAYDEEMTYGNVVESYNR